MGTPETFREPCPDRILDDFGAGFGIGAIGGSAFHFIKGRNNSPKGSRFFGGIQAVRMNAPRVGGILAVWAGLYSTFDCTMVYLRQKEDPWNSIISAAATGGFLSLRKGLGRASVAAAVGGCLFALIEGTDILPGMQDQEKMMSESQNQNTSSSSSRERLFGKKKEEVQPRNGSKTEVLESFDAPPVPSYD